MNVQDAHLDSSHVQEIEMLEVTGSMRGLGLKAAVALLAAALMPLADRAGSSRADTAPRPAALVPDAPLTFAEGADMIPVDAKELEPEGGG
jgi:hypothetical protein